VHTYGSEKFFRTFSATDLDFGNARIRSPLCADNPRVRATEYLQVGDLARR
jgi:hypothetical protein